MCSIMGCCGPMPEMAAFTEGFERTRSRGPDDSRIVKLDDGILCFHRLSIMGLDPTGMQPFELDGSYVVCNGEIYGYEKIKEELSSKYTFKSGSDCEVLLPLWREYGTDMFKMLDAEFACIIYDAETHEFIAARDPIGIRPLFYGYDMHGTMLFASEAKNLVGLVWRVRPFPPGCYWKGGQFHRYADPGEAGPVIRGTEDEICAGIRERLIKGVEKRLVSDAKVGFLLSGGLDSSLVCAIAARLTGKKIRTFAIGMSGDAIDLGYAREVAEFIGSDHMEVVVPVKEAVAALSDVIATIGSYDITTVRASVGMYLVCKAIHEQTDVRVLLTGEVSDELFGYKYTDFAPSAEEFQKEAQKRMRELMAPYGTRLMAWAPLAEGRNGIFTHPTLMAIGAKYGKTAAQTALRFLMAEDVIAIPKSVHRERLVENFSIDDFELSAEDLDAIRALDGEKPMFADFNDPTLAKFLLEYDAKFNPERQ